MNDFAFINAFINELLLKLIKLQIHYLVHPVSKFPGKDGLPMRNRR